MEQIAKQIGIFIMALIIIGIPFLDGLLTIDTLENATDRNLIVCFLTVCSAIDLFIVFILINHCM